MNPRLIVAALLLFLVVSPLVVAEAAALDLSSPDTGFGFQNGNYLYFRDPVSVNVEQIASDNATYGDWVFVQEIGSSETFGFYATGVDVTVNTFFEGDILELSCVGSGSVQVQVGSRVAPTSISVYTGSYDNTNKIETITVSASGTTELVWGADVSLNLTAGWNLISFPILPYDTSFTSILSGVSYYQVCSDWNGSAYSVPTVAEAGKSYWIFVLSDTSVAISGTEVSSVTISLAAGWNMIGSINGETLSAATVFLASGYYQLDSWSNGYVVASTLEPGKGYFAFVLHSQSITLS